MPRRPPSAVPDTSTLRACLALQKHATVSPRLYQVEPQAKKHQMMKGAMTTVTVFDEKSPRAPRTHSSTQVHSPTSVSNPEIKMLHTLSAADDTQMKESDFEVEGPEDILAKAWESIGKKPKELESHAHLDICMMVLPDNLVECVDGQLDDALRLQLLGEASLRQAQPQQPQAQSKPKKKVVRNPWYMDPKTWYSGENSEESSTENQSGGLSPEDKANLHICDVYRRYCLKEGKRIPQCLT